MSRGTTKRRTAAFLSVRRIKSVVFLLSDGIATVQGWANSLVYFRVDAINSAAGRCVFVEGLSFYLHLLHQSLYLTIPPWIIISF